MLTNIQPVFILGNPRSGTSLFRLILNNHPNIVATPESGFAHWLLNKYADWRIEDNHERINEFIKDLQQTKKFETWNLEDERIKSVIQRYHPENYSALVASVYLSYADDSERIKCIVDKNNYYIHHIQDLVQIWPNAKYIHIIRDGRDVACSYIDIEKLKSTSDYIPKLTTDIREIAEEWNTNNRKISQLKSLGSKKYFLLKYEDLILHTRNSLENLMVFMDLSFEEEMLGYYKTDSKNRIEPQETLAWKVKTKEKPDKEKVGRYKQSLSLIDINMFTNIAQEQLKLYNYEL